MVGSCEDFIRFSAVSKSWQSVAFKMMQEGSVFLLSPESPLLLLAEEVPEGSLRCCDINVDEDGLEEANDDEDSEEEYQDEDEDEEGQEEEGEEAPQEDEEGQEGQEGQEEEGEEAPQEDEEGQEGQEEEYEDEDEDEENEDQEGEEEDEGQEEGGNNIFDQLILSVGNARGIYSLSTGNTYTIDLPQAAGKWILGTSKGWVLTLGTDSQTNLLHPLLRHQIPLPSMTKCSKVALSSRVSGNDTPQPTIMVIYGEVGSLGFARFGDQEWKQVESPSVGPFVDITYHKGKFYGINHAGDIFECNIDDDYTSGATGEPITFCPSHPDDSGSMYLVDSENDLWFLERTRRVKHFKPPNNMRVKYRTTNFLVWRLEPTVSEDGHETIGTWVQKHDLGGKAFFVGLNASVSLSSSDCVRPNCIYFTDDISDLYFPDGGGHDMGIFDVERGTIEQHFQGKSLHPISPPLWQDGSTFLLSSESPLLLLAEEVPEGSLRCCDINVDEDGLEEEEPNDDENMEEEYEDEDADEDQNGQEEEDEEGDHFPDEEGHDNENIGFGGKPVYSLSW
ncbi:hypothetical protein ACET3Z_029973 [Daucus carota]